MLFDFLLSIGLLLSPQLAPETDHFTSIQNQFIIDAFQDPAIAYQLSNYRRISTTEHLVLTEKQDESIIHLTGILGSKEIDCGKVEFIIQIRSQSMKNASGILRQATVIRTPVQSAYCDT